MSELRQHPRYAVALTVDIEHGGQHLPAQSKDLSRGGMALSAASPLPLSTTVELSIQLVFENDSFSEPLKLPALVVWCTRLGDGWQIGAKFAKLSRENRTYLDVFLKFLEGEPDGIEDDDTPPHGTRSGA